MYENPIPIPDQPPELPPLENIPKRVIDVTDEEPYEEPDNDSARVGLVVMIPAL